MVETIINSLNARDETMNLTSRFFAMIFFLAGIAFSQPKLSLDKPDVDLGKIFSGEKKKGKIVLKNIGNDTLRIFSVQPQCGCTTVKQPKEFLLPGQSDDVELEFNSAGYRGKVEKHVNINTNDPTSQFITVKLLADVKEILQPVSGSNMLWMNNITIGKPETQIVTVKNVSGLPIMIQGDSVSSASISVTMDKKTLQPDDTLNIHVTVVPNKSGYSNEHFYIITNHKIQPFVELRVTYTGIKEN
jgi:Protein of unknown function (DUF1573)